MDKINSIDDIDFNELWKKAKLNSSFERIHRGYSIWDDKERAKNYDKNVKEDNYKKATEQQIKKLKIDSNSTVLDIGAGPGTLTIPLAKMVKKVTAIEPAQGMLECLQENIKENRLNNITVINKRWEEVSIDEIGKHDIVIASFSLGMLDLKEALKKMNDAASKYVYIFHPVGTTKWEKMYEEIWQRLNRDRYVSTPKAVYIYNILYQIGIYANIEINETEYYKKFKDIENAINEYKWIVNVKTKEEEEILRKYLSESTVRENGNLVLKGKTMHAMIWWKKYEK